jgi:hypothetical protein
MDWYKSLTNTLIYGAFDRSQWWALCQYLNAYANLEKEPTKNQIKDCKKREIDWVFEFI